MSSEIKQILESNFNWLNNPDGAIKRLANGDVDLSIERAEKEIVELIEKLVSRKELGSDIIYWGNNN